MGVAKIANKSLQNPSKLDTGITHSTSKDFISVFDGRTTYYIPTMYLVLIDDIYQKNTTYHVLSQFRKLKLLSDILSFITKKNHAKILYAIFKLKFASVHFMKRNAGIKNNAWVGDIIHEYEVLNIIKKISKKDEDQDIIRRFWNDVFRNTPRKNPVELYRITNEFIPIVEAFAGIIEDHYFSRPEISMINHLRRRYEIFSDSVRKNLNLAQAENARKLGNCIQCRGIIRKGDKIGCGGYHTFKAGLVCDTCKRAATRKVLGQWMQNTK